MTDAAVLELLASYEAALDQWKRTYETARVSDALTLPAMTKPLNRRAFELLHLDSG